MLEITNNFQAIAVDSAFPESTENNKFIELKSFETRILNFSIGYRKYISVVHEQQSLFLDGNNCSI